MSTYSQFQQIPNRDPAAKTPIPTSPRLFERADADALKVIARAKKLAKSLGKGIFVEGTGCHPQPRRPRAQMWPLAEQEALKWI